jgi:adenine-specific DNA-methyltransferase
MAKKNGGGMLPKRNARKKELGVEALKHKEAKRRYIPTEELASVVPEEDKAPIRAAYERRNRDLDPQLVWRQGR